MAKKDKQINIEAMAEEARKEFLKQIENSDESPQNKRALIAMFKEMSITEFIQLAFNGYRKEEKIKEDEVKFLPPFSKRSPVRIDFGDSGIKWLNESIIQLSWKVKPGIYFTCYFVKLGEQDVLACVNMGTLFNYLFGKDVCHEQIMPSLPNKMRKKYPLISLLLPEFLNDFHDKKPYLNTIGLGHQPKQWRLMMHLREKEAWVELKLNGSASTLLCDTINELKAAFTTIVQDIVAGNDQKFIDLLKTETGFVWF